LLISEIWRQKVRYGATRSFQTATSSVMRPAQKFSTLVLRTARARKDVHGANESDPTPAYAASTGYALHAPQWASEIHRCYGSMCRSFPLRDSPAEALVLTGLQIVVRGTIGKI
jgi:hypothetical protein